MGGVFLLVHACVCACASVFLWGAGQGIGGSSFELLKFLHNYLNNFIEDVVVLLF